MSPDPTRPLRIPSPLPVCLALLLASAGACGADESGDDEPRTPLGPGGISPGDPTDAVFQPNHVLEVAITIADADWDELRFQKRTIMDIFGGDCLGQPFDSPFTYFPASVIIDGKQVADVGVRKKGFLGSLSPTKPSLKIKFDEYVENQRFSGMKRMTFNNARQDPGFINQCMGYQLFADAGMIAPRCSFAHITVNGEDLGVFAHVESLKKPFIARHFDDDSGNLYEGTLSDFRDDWKRTFQAKTNRTTPPGSEDRSDIDAMVDAMDLSDAAMVAELDKLVDMDGFMTMWAMEAVVGHWDGYANNTNNFYIYRDPDTDLFNFIPWGIDALLFDDAQVQTGEASVALTTGILARRLYQYPDTRESYIDRIMVMLDAVWDETALLAEVDRMTALIEPYLLTGELEPFNERIGEARDFIRDRRAAIGAAVEPSPPPVDRPLREPMCFTQLGTAQSSFTTTWGSIGTQDPFVAGGGTANIVIDGQPVAITTVGAVAGLGGEQDATAVLAVLGVLTDGSTALLYIETDPANIIAGKTLELDWSEATGMLYQFPPGSEEAQLVGLLGDGTVTLNDAGTTPGAALDVTIDAVLYRSFF